MLQVRVHALHGAKVKAEPVARDLEESLTITPTRGILTTLSLPKGKTLLATGRLRSPQTNFSRG